MRSQVSFAGGSSGREEFPADFFAAVNQRDEDTAFASVRRVAMLPDGQPSPRVVELGGEWDSSVVVSLAWLKEECCAGSLGGEERFCGKRRGTCTIAGHKKSTRTVKEGWYIAAGSRLSGYYWVPSLPTERDGGPITATGAAYLSQLSDPLRMTRASWMLVMEAWHEWNALRRPRLLQREVGPSTPSTLGMGESLPLLPSRRETPAPLGTTHRAPRKLEVFTDIDVRVEEEQNGPSVDPFDAVFEGFVDEGPFSTGLDATEHEPVPVEAARTRRGSGTPTDRNWTDMERRLEQQARDAADAGIQLGAMVAEVGRLKRAMDAMVQAMDEQMELRTCRLADVETEGQALRRRVASLEAERGAEVDTALVARVQTCEDNLFNEQGVVPQLALTLRNFKERVDSGGGIECNGLRFPSMREALDWYTVKGVSTPGLFIDALALLHGISGAYVSMAHSGKRRETQGKNKFTNDVEEFVVQSFDTTIPGSFVGGKHEVDGASAHAVLKAALKNFQAWKPRGELTTGLSTQILDGVGQRNKQMRAFRQEHTYDLEVKELSQGLLFDSVQFCQELVGFINTQNDSLTHDTTYTAEQIWDMQLECIRTIFQELADARSEFMMPAQSVPAYYMWGMLKAWEIQQRYLRNHFKDDPALMGIFVRRVILQAGNDGFKDKFAKLDKLQDQVIEHNRVHTQAISQLKTIVAKIKQ
jgi:hypothetical protein